MFVAGSWISVKKGVNGGLVVLDSGCVVSGWSAAVEWAGRTEEDVVCRRGEGRGRFACGGELWVVREEEGVGGMGGLICGGGEA